MVEYSRKGETMTIRSVAFAIVGFFVYTQFAQGAMSSTNYEIRWDTFSTGGLDTTNSSSYQLRDSVGPAGGSTSSSTNYQLQDGYRSGIFDQIITFDLYIQNSSNERAITSLSGTTVSMSSTSGLTVGDYVAVVQDRGVNQVSAIGRIQSVAAGSIVLDRLVTSGSAPSIDGANDYIYQLNASSLTVESPEAEAVGTGIIAFEITSDNDSGYVIQIVEDGNLRNGSEVVNDVEDGSVTVGYEEYGGRSNDSTLSNSTFDTQDSAITTSAQEIVSRSSFAFDDRSYLTLKIGASTGTSALTYSQTLTFIASGNF